MKTTLWRFIVRATFRTLIFVLRIIPWKVALAWATLLGTIGYHATARYRNMADKNLKLAYGDELTEQDRVRISKGVFRHYARMLLIECLKAPQLSPDQLRKMVKVESYAPVEELLARGKGMLLISGHIGNWELLARRAALDGFSFAVIVRQSQDAALNVITDYLRENGGYPVHPRGGSLRPILKRIRDNGIVAIMPDQKSDDLFVPFFSSLVGTVAGPAVLSLKTGAPILPMFSIREPDGSYRVIILPEVDSTSTGDMATDTYRIMADITRVIEEMVRKYPEQWLWLHDRWKMPPGMELKRVPTTTNMPTEPMEASL